MIKYKFIFLILLILNLRASNGSNEELLNQNRTLQTTPQCHYSCSSCTDTSAHSCIECSDTSRGYDGYPGYRQTCYCLGDYSESYTSACDEKDSTNQALDIFIAIFLWIIFPASLVVSAFGNQFLGMYSIELIQTLGYSYYINEPLPATMHNTLYQLRYYSLSNLNTLMRSSFITKYNITTEIIDYVIVDQQQLGEPLFTYYEVPANFLYNGTIHMIAIFSIYLIFGLLLIIYIKYPPHKDSFLVQAYKARKTITLRIYQFFVGELFLFSCIQCTNIIFTTPMGSMGFIVTVMIFLLLWVGFAYGFYLINMNKVKFEDKENQVFFNKLKKNDKMNRNFLIIQLVNKFLVILFMVMFISTYDMQIIAVMSIQTFFSLLTIFKIQLKKKRHQIYLYLVNICKIIINCFLIMFAKSSGSVKLTAGWLFKLSIFFTLIIIIVYLLIELISQFPEIVTFIRQTDCIGCIKQRSNSMISLEMQQCNYLSQTKSFKNQIYNYFKDDVAYEQVVNEYLDKYEFVMPEEDENDIENEDNENPENLDINLNGDSQNQNNENDNHNHEEDQENEFDPEEYLRQTNQ